jgi:tRNA pseudouridine55 synthase
MASGVLPVLLGRATRLADFIQAGRKTYVATVTLGSSTDSDDAEGTPVAEAPVPPLTRSTVDDALRAFTGEILQRPPAYSALKVKGQRAYALARRGEHVDLAPRPVSIDEISLLEWSATAMQVEVTCSKGTYVRALARDIAIALGTVGHLSALTRTRVGPFSIESSNTLDVVATRGVQDCLVPPTAALPDAATFHADPTESARLANGQAIPYLCADMRADCVWVHDPTGSLVCLASAEGRLLRPRLML